MKNKLINTLLLSGVIAATLVGCNSGGGTNNTPNTNTGNTQSIAMANKNNSEAIGAEEGLFNIITGNIEEAITDQVGSALWNLVTKDQLSPQSTAEWNKEALILIQHNLQGIEAELNDQNTELNTIINDLTNFNSQTQKIPIATNLSAITTEGTDLADLIGKVAPGQGESMVESLEVGKQPLSNSQIQSLVAYLNQNSIGNLVPAYSSNVVDAAEQNLSCDNSNNDSWYSWNNPTQNATNHPMPNLQTGCILADALNSAYSRLTAIVSLNNSTNVLNAVLVFDQMLDTQYLQIVQALTSAYYLDQLRLYLELNAPNGGITALKTINPNDNNLADIAAAESDLNTAYETRLNFVKTLFKQTKKQAFDYYTGSIQSTSLALVQNCNFNESAIESVGVSSIASDMSAQANQYGWDGSTLIMTCQSKPFGQITTTTNLATLCTTNHGTSYNLSSSNGYIRCGAASSTPSGTVGNGYGNYSANNIMTSPEPYQPSYDSALSWTSLEATALSYAPYVNENTDGNLDVNFVGQPLVAWQYNGYNNGGEEATYNSPANNFVDIYFNQYTCFHCSGVSSQWSYVDDGIHAYMIAGSDAQLVIACLPNDNNCTFASGPNNPSFGGYNGNYVGLVFSNGDAIAVNQNMGHGDYNIQTFYNGTPTPFQQYSIFNPSNGGEPGQNTTADFLSAFPNVIYNIM